jgi:2-aminoethylphosphonate-pyruvate transaminase
VLIKAIKELGLEMPVPESEQSHLIVTIMDPKSPKYSFNDMHDLSREHGYTIYPGKLSDAPTFRIANIGDIRPEEMKGFTEILAYYMRSIQ